MVIALVIAMSNTNVFSQINSRTMKEDTTINQADNFVYTSIGVAKAIRIGGARRFWNTYASGLQNARWGKTKFC